MYRLRPSGNTPNNVPTTNAAAQAAAISATSTNMVPSELLAGRQHRPGKRRRNGRVPDAGTDDRTERDPERQTEDTRCHENGEHGNSLQVCVCMLVGIMESPRTLYYSRDGSGLQTPLY